jgi:hypothetical protein
MLTIARAAAAQTPSQPVVAGVVMDQTGAVLAGARVDLVGNTGTAVQSAVADAVGGFRFEKVAAGQYQLKATYEGFKEASTRLRVGARSPGAQKLVLGLANVKEDVTVSNGGDRVDTGASNNLDSIAVDQDVLDSLPIFDRDYIATISRFLDAGSIGGGGATIVVNGLEVSALRVSASAVQQIKINQDPYSAEYARPGRGRIEILTKPGGQAYEGEGNIVVRDGRLDARNAFAATRSPEQKRIFEGVFSGPVGSGGKTSFTLSANDNYDDQQAEVFAIGPAGAIHDIVPQVNREALVSLSINRQWSDHTTISIRPSYEYEKNQNRGVGGTTLASAGTTFTHHEQQVTYTQQTTVRPTLLHQFQMLVGHEREPTRSASPARGIVVAGAFTSGGQGDLVQTEVHTQLTDSLVWIKGHHQVQAGFQLPDWSQRGFLDQTNFNGTYYFSGLDAYAAGRPYSFVEQQGNGDVRFLEKQVGVYLKDDWQWRPGLSATFGVRYDWQNYFHDSNNIAPRASIAYAPGNKKTNVIRAGAGFFNDRSGAAAIADLLHNRPGGLIRYVISNPSYPDPFSGGTAAPPAAGVVQLAADVQIPQTLQYSAGIDHQLSRTLTLSATYSGARGYHLFRSRDINAPRPPLYLVRPDSTRGVVREIESDGRQTTDSLQVTLRGRLGRLFNGQTQYTLSRADNDTNGINSYPANDYDLTGEWGRADFDRRHRLLLLGSITPGRIVDIGVGLSMNSAGPYSEMLGEDIYSNGRGRARPAGVGRNTLTAAAYSQLDLRVSRNVKIGAGKDERSIGLALDAFNVLNRVNYSTFVGTSGSPLFREPVSARAPRQLQMSLRLKF